MSLTQFPSTTSLTLRKPFSSHNPTQSTLPSKPISALHLPQEVNNPISRKSYNPTDYSHWKNKGISSLLSSGIAFSFVSSITSGEASAAELHLLGLQLSEPDNALSLPTWAIHVSSVVEWIIAMVLVWQYGERPGYESWKGLSWGMVPLLGGAFCACTWHFFYNAESLSVLVALQAALTVVGNFTMCIAAFRIYKSSQQSSENL